MKQFISAKIYRELWNVLNIKMEVKEKIPLEVLKCIYKNAMNSGYSFNYTKDVDVIKIMSNDAFCLYAYLYIKYVANDVEKEKMKKILLENEIEYKNSSYKY